MLSKQTTPHQPGTSHLRHRPLPPAAPGDALPFLGPLALKRPRAHEATGPARYLLALLVAGQSRGPVFWVAPGWSPAQLYGPGMVRFVDPGRFIFVRADRPVDILWSLEEVMRSGAAALVIGDLPAPPGLTPVRRLHLAGEAGARHGSHKPIALLLSPEGAAPGVESRWHMAPTHGPDMAGESWQLTRSRAGGNAPQSWQVQPKGAGFTLEQGPSPAALINF